MQKATKGAAISLIIISIALILISWLIIAVLPEDRVIKPDEPEWPQ